MDLVSISKKWQKKWSEKGIYKVKEDNKKKKFYILDMFPYPSGAGLHVGHPKGYIASDTIARKKMLEGYNVLHPMGFDTFGLGTENYAIEHKMKPQDVAKKNIETYIQQLEMFGCTYDWDRTVNTADPKYFKRTQWIFLQLYNHYYDDKLQKAMPITDPNTQERLAYIDYKPINRCPSCMTGLANEDLDDGKCERCGSEVEQKPMKQRVLRITKYAQRLIEGLDKLNREESMKELERNWIGKSEGTQFKMKIYPTPALSTEWKGVGGEVSVYTTRVDTIFGMSFVAISPEHSLVDKITTDEFKSQIEKYKESSKHKTQLERTELQKEKTGVFCGAYAINPFNDEKVPIFVADYVLVNYGTGVVMGVPAHDERDFQFAKKYNLPIVNSILPSNKNYINYEKILKGEICYYEKGILNNSQQFSGKFSDIAINEMQEWLEKKGLGGKKINYKMQDWVFSRQRYRGEPFPVLRTGGKSGKVKGENKIIPLNESDLPVTLPDVENYQPTGTVQGPLANISDWVDVKLPDGSFAKRETNTMPGWAGSSRYWMRYMDPKNDKKLVSKETDQYRKNVDVYIGGAEHVTRHMIYARFRQKFLYDIGAVSQDEPFLEYHSVGLIMGEDGRKMSKRWGNVVNPDDIINQFGTDTLRTYEMFMGPFDQAIARNTKGINGTKKFLDKIIALQNKLSSFSSKEGWSEGQEDLETKETLLLHQTIKKIGEDIDGFKFNTAISQLMIFVNHLTEQEKISKDVFEKLVILISPFAPHLAEELREQLGNEFSIFTKAKWPSYDESKLISDDVTMAVQINGKVRGTITISREAEESEVMEKIKSDSKLSSYLIGIPKKIIYVKGKIVNIVL